MAYVRVCCLYILGTEVEHNSPNEIPLLKTLVGNQTSRKFLLFEGESVYTVPRPPELVFLPKIFHNGTGNAIRLDSFSLSGLVNSKSWKTFQPGKTSHRSRVQTESRVGRILILIRRRPAIGGRAELGYGCLALSHAPRLTEFETKGSGILCTLDLELSAHCAVVF